MTGTVAATVGIRDHQVVSPSDQCADRSRVRSEVVRPAPSDGIRECSTADSRIQVAIVAACAGDVHAAGLDNTGHIHQYRRWCGQGVRSAHGACVGIGDRHGISASSDTVAVLVVAAVVPQDAVRFHTSAHGNVDCSIGSSVTGHVVPVDVRKHSGNVQRRWCGEQCIHVRAASVRIRHHRLVEACVQAVDILGGRREAYTIRPSDGVWCCSPRDREVHRTVRCSSTGDIVAAGEIAGQQVQVQW